MMKIKLRLATPIERDFYKKDYAPCMIGDAKLLESDTVVIAYLTDELSLEIDHVALFIYEKVSDDIVDGVCIVNLHVGNWFPIACKRMFSYWRENYKVIRVPVDKGSPIVGWCDKLYERIEEDEDSIIFDGAKLKRMVK